jgi:hypothetical protein
VLAILERVRPLVAAIPSLALTAVEEPHMT